MSQPRPTTPRLVRNADDAADLVRRFERRRRELLERLDDPRHHARACDELDQLHVEYRTLQRVPADAAPAKPAGDERVERMRKSIEAALEDGLLRHSRRQRLIEEGLALGFSSFHTQLLIAQVQAGERELLVPASRQTEQRERERRTASRYAAALLFALGMFLALVRWAHGASG